MSSLECKELGVCVREIGFGLLQLRITRQTLRGSKQWSDLPLKEHVSKAEVSLGFPSAVLCR